ncbi:hypothetical protein BHM03_00054529 [Ensete ventricosum]|nr:hypothetical protein BHM03_00054529 [Ensete ventricosum]
MPDYLQGAVGCSRPKGQPPAGTTGSGQPVRGCHPQPALPPVGAADLVEGVATPWQGGCQPQRAVAACVGTAPTAA